MNFAFWRVFILVALATISNLPAQSGPASSLFIPPPQVTESRPIPLSPGQPATTPVFVPGSRPAVPGAEPGLFTSGAKPEMLDLIPTLLVRNRGKAMEY